MRLNRFVRTAVVVLTCFSMVAPTRCFAAHSEAVAATGTPYANTHQADRPTASDVSLTREGQFTGQLRDREGQPLIGASVQLIKAGRVVAETTSRFDGGFAFTTVRPGFYHVAAAGRLEGYRVWQASVAPPSARPGALIVSGDVLRGQNRGMGSGLFDGAFMNALSNPWLVAGVLAAGIAIPIAVANDDSSDGS